MRFSAPRSLSPSPVGRPSRRRSSTFGLIDDSGDDSDYAHSDSDEDSEAAHSEYTSSSDASSDSFCYASESEVPPAPPKPKRRLDPAEQRYIDDTVAAIRLRTRHHDPYEEWERQTRKDAYSSARKEQVANQAFLRNQHERSEQAEKRRLDELHAQQVKEVQLQLEGVTLKRRAEETRLRDGWAQQDKKLWERIEQAIKLDEDKVRARLEEERKKQEEEERKKREEELKKRLEEEKKRQEEEERKRKEEEEKRLQEEKKRQEEEAERLKAERLQAEAGARKALGLRTADEDWTEARRTLQRLKTEVMRVVKSNKEMKSAWSSARRQITPKIGQITNDPEAISRISQQLFQILKPAQPHQEQIYIALLSSLAKAILLQAETEVTAEKRSALPLAQVTFNMLEQLEHFPEIFFAKLVQRAGGWPVPIVVSTNIDPEGLLWKDEADRIKAMGYRRSSRTEGEMESGGEYLSRVAGMMRVYFHVLRIRPQRHSLHPLFQLPRYWTWVARLMSDKRLLEADVAAELLYTALDVMGSHAKAVWGMQWIKMLALIHSAATTGIGDDRSLGGETAEGKAARARVLLEIDRIMAS